MPSTEEAIAFLPETGFFLNFTNFSPSRRDYDFNLPDMDIKLAISFLSTTAKYYEVFLGDKILRNGKIIR